MAPLEDGASAIAERALCPSNYYYSNGYCYPNSAWYWWGRWVFAGVVIVVVIGILVLLGCVSARRRRRRGVSPMYGTGWMGGKYNTGQQNNAQAYQYGPPPPPQYSQNTIPQQYTGQTYDSNQGYYGGNNYQQGGVPLQQPQNVYNRGGEHGYQPPPGPPPTKVA